MNTILFQSTITEHADAICDALQQLPLAKQVEALNEIRQKLHDIGPFASEPVDCVLWVDSKTVEANDYNPNTVATPEYKSLRRSIRKFGYGMPIVTSKKGDKDVIADGFHRGKLGKEDSEIRNRVYGYLPVARIKPDARGRNNLMQATILFNRARGEHGVMPMTSIVAEMKQNGWEEDEIAQELGMDADEVLRYLNNAGLPALFKNHEYSRAWE